MGKKELQEMKKLVVLEDPNSPISEKFRSIRTSIEFATINMDMKILVITSSEQNSGKSLVASNLAVTFAQKGKKTLLIDGDFRNPSIKNYFYIPRGKGLSSLLRGKISISDAVHPTNETNLFILPPGFSVLNPADILGSKNMGELLDKLSQRFDQIIIDTPPILVATDAAVVSTFADGILLVVRSGKTKKENAKKGLRLMHQSLTPIIGVILNDIQMNKNEDYYYRLDGNN